MVSTQRLTSGMKLAKPVFASDGRVLLRAGVALTDGYITRLRGMGYTYVYIDDGETFDINVEDSVPMEIRQHVVGRIKTVYDQMADAKRMERIIQSGELGKEFNSLFQMLFDHLRSSSSFVLHMGAIYSSDAYLYTHCMNVGIYACVLGMANGYRDDKLKNLGVGAMLHDIGKLAIPRHILEKPGELTADERAEVEKHCWVGYDILVKQPDLSALSAHCALQHHERIDGSGYPRKLRGDAIHEFGRLLAVADVYDAMTSNRIHCKAYLPHEAMEYLFANSGTKFERKFVDLFKQYVNVYPPGLPVVLSTGSKGVVARQSANLQRPVVLITEENGEKVTPYELDLSLHFNIMIAECDLPGVIRM